MSHIFATNTESEHSLKGVCLLLLQTNRADPRESKQQEVIYDSVLVCLEVCYALSDFCVENSSPTLDTIVGRSLFSAAPFRGLILITNASPIAHSGLFLISTYILNQLIVLFGALPHGGTILAWHIHLQGIFHSR